jgi:cold shock protein
MNGKVKFFNDMKGFGFIIGDDGKEYFVHQSRLTPGLKLEEKQSVTFEVEEGPKGLVAVNVNVQ